MAAVACIARDPGVRLRDITAGLGIMERSAHSIVTDLAAAGTSSSRRTAAATAARSRRTSHYQNRPAASPPFGAVLAVLAVDGTPPAAGADASGAITP
ncbi:MAG TPA: hypothetical protein VF940_18430 [Streptosporangiaceae bacterium]